MSENYKLLVTLITPIAAVLVAFFVACISFLQWKINREKLRLDLYNRRFDVYSRTLDFYQVIILYSGTNEDLELQKRFLTATREARFIFPQSSGVHEFLIEIRNHAHEVMRFQQRFKLLSGEQEQQARLHKSYQNDLDWLSGCMEKLETKMESYLQFNIN